MSVTDITDMSVTDNKDAWTGCLDAVTTYAVA
jgi:hypothetical protein